MLFTADVAADGGVDLHLPAVKRASRDADVAFAGDAGRRLDRHAPGSGLAGPGRTHLQGRLDEADAAVSAAVSGGEVAVLSLDPFGRPAPDLPIGVTDYATAVRVHGDQIVPEPRPGPALGGRSVDQVLADCQSSAAARGLTSSDRVLSGASWSGPAELVDGLLAIMAVGGSLVQVASADPAGQERRIETEKVTRVL